MVFSKYQVVQTNAYVLGLCEGGEDGEDGEGLKWFDMRVIVFVTSRAFKRVAISWG